MISILLSKTLLAEKSKLTQIRLRRCSANENKIGTTGTGWCVMKELRVIVAGSRDFNNYQLLSDKIMDYLENIDDKNLIENPKQIKFISGTARGADVLGEQFAYTWGYDVVRFPADWDGLGKRAGYVRNAEMAKYAIADGNYGVLIVFWDGKSKGTKHMIDLAEKNGLEVHIVRF